MNFNQLAWGALCFYYRSAGDQKYGKTMNNKSFLQRLRHTPSDISVAEFEETVILGHVNIENYDLLIGHNLAGSVLAKIIDLQPEITALQGISLLDFDFSNSEMVDNVKKIYAGLYSVRGLWLTGVSKISHLLNDRLMVLLNLDISTHFKLIEGNTSLIQWLKITQDNMREVTEDFQWQGLPGSPGEFLSEKLGYTRDGYQKSLVKFIDEYFWLRLGDNLPVPPPWAPPFVEGEE
jgi:hypothetical protein